MELRLRHPFPLSTQLIGVDGGATEVKVHEVVVAADERGTRLALGERAASLVYPLVPGFETPASRGIGNAASLGEIDAGEREQGWAWIEATADCIVRLAREREAKSVLVGIAMPGVKTADGRGLAFALNGPRIPEFMAQLERRLAGESLDLCAPLERLEGDGWCSGLGEELGQGGLFHGAENAYYLGGGTGLAEALKIDGSLLPPERWAAAFRRARSLTDSIGVSFDESLSATGINRRYAECSTLAAPLLTGNYPEQRLHQDPEARRMFELAGVRLAELIGRRMSALSQRLPERDDRAPRATAFDRVVVGQRLGALLADQRTRKYFWRSLQRSLQTWVASDKLLNELYLNSERALEELVVCSTMRAAPAIGAAATALIAWDRTHG